MKPIILFLLLMHIFNYAQTDSSNLTIELNKGFFLADLVKDKEAGSHPIIWVMSGLAILDTLDNVIKTETFWHQGPYFYTPKIEFTGEKYSTVRVKLHCFTPIPEIDTTIIIGKIRNLKLTLRKEESDSLLKKTTQIEQMEDGDSLVVLFSEYGRDDTNATIKIEKQNGKFSIEIKEKISPNIEKNLKKTDLSDYEIQLLKAFELDSYRELRYKAGSDLGNYYDFQFKGQTRRVNDSCAHWSGYWLLKKGIFH